MWELNDSSINNLIYFQACWLSIKSAHHFFDVLVFDANAFSSTDKF